MHILRAFLTDSPGKPHPFRQAIPLSMQVIDLVGVAVFAISGALAGGRKGLDLLGVTVVAIVTSIGGGTLRDLLLNRHPIFWIADPSYLWAALAGTAATVAYTRLWVTTRRALLVADALGLAFFVIGGVQITLQAGHSALIALLMGTITGVAGGVIRDLLIGEIPLVLRPGRLYATAAIAGALVFLLLRPLLPTIAAVAGMVTTATLRLLAIRYELTLPVLPVPPDVSAEHPTPGRGQDPPAPVA
jgi:uncharacterized membrane protein YeiH